MDKSRYRIEILSTCELWVKDEETGSHTFAGLPDLSIFLERHPEVKEMFCKEMLGGERND